MDLRGIRRQIRFLSMAEPELPLDPRLDNPDALDRHMQNGIRPEVLGDAYGADPFTGAVRVPAYVGSTS